jgi:glutaminyl-tRNA synthetase
LPVPTRPRQYESARLNLNYTVLSKRFLTQLISQGRVSGWDDPRMPTLAALRRRGVPPAAIRDFVRRVGVARANSIVDVAMFEHSIRELLNKSAQRRMAVLRPLRLVIENYPLGRIEELDAVNNPENPAAGTGVFPTATRRARRFYGAPAQNFYRLSPGREVRLRYSCRDLP